MNINNLFESFSDEEKEELLKIAYSWKFPESNSEPKLTDIRVWISAQPKISVRLQNVFLRKPYWSDNELYTFEELPFKYLELVSQKEFLRIRNSGIKSWREFVALRGF